MESKACPSMAGNMVGYSPEYQNEDKIWKPIKTMNASCGVLRGRIFAEFLSVTNLYGYEAAMAIAWMFKANNDRHVEIRIVPYKINYNVEAFRDEEKIEEIKIDERNFHLI